MLSIVHFNIFRNFDMKTSDMENPAINISKCRWSLLFFAMNGGGTRRPCKFCELFLHVGNFGVRMDINFSPHPLGTCLELGLRLECFFLSRKLQGKFSAMFFSKENFSSQFEFLLQFSRKKSYFKQSSIMDRGKYTAIW